MQTNPQDEAALNWFSGKKILVTGGGGFIASALIAKLSDIDCELVRLLRQPGAPEPTSGRARVRDVVGDARSAELWSALPDGMDVVFHLAAQTSTYQANRDPRADLESNVVPMLLMLKACQDRGLKPAVIAASTVTICGLPARLPVDESFPDIPVTIYDLHKQMAENYLKYHVRSGTVTGASLRLANVYGPGPRSSRADRGILNQMVGRALRGEALTVYGSGEQLRDYIHVDDVVRAFLLAAVNAEALGGQHYVIARGEGHSIAAALRLVTDRVAARTGRYAPVVSVKPPPGLSPIEARNFVADVGRFAGMTGWQPCYSLDRGIDTIVESLL